MAKLVWNAIGEHFFEIGVRNGVLYPVEDNAYPTGVAWNGLSSVTESPDGGDSNDIYADDIKYLSIRSVENFKGTIEAFYYPDEFKPCNGEAEVVNGVTIGQQARKAFGFAYKTSIGNDVDFQDYGYKINLVWGCSISPSEETHETINESPEPEPFSWEFDTVPVTVTGHKATAHMEIDSTKFKTTEQQAALAAFEEILYGRDAADAVPATYKATTDETPQAGKTYYTRTGAGTTESPYVYAEFEGSTFVSQTTYYEIATPAKDAVTALTARLPLPDEVISLLTVT